MEIHQSLAHTSNVDREYDPFCGVDTNQKYGVEE